MKLRRGLIYFGTVFFDYLVLSLLMTVSLVLVLPFFYIFVGVIGYFYEDRNVRTYGTIFRTIKENFHLITLFALFNLGIIIFASANIHYLTVSQSWMTKTVVFISYFLIILDLAAILNGPSLIIKMKLTFFELLVNCFRMIFIRLPYFLLHALFMTLALLVITKVLWAPLLLLVPIALVNYHLTRLVYKYIDDKRKTQEQTLSEE